MTASAEIQTSTISDPAFAGELPESFAASASPVVRALATEWIASSRAHFLAVERRARTSNAPPSRHQVETERDIAMLEDEAVRRRIIDMAPAEPGALALKAAAFLVHLSGPNDVAIADAVGDDGPSAEAFAFTLAGDLVNLLGPSVQDLADMAWPGRPR